ncbi:TraR/DksA family transcriptional regulator [Actinophytocola algeriensis]|uniref:RNA polymerase-binding transcription factor DksA n=1 Tax=Actinophytocola algeriensis TaxID=1768010 RepID=A0A7W7VGN1_9PSEU|nr:TraR/DksA C4-type zinc finger protein [Actinophytocola algeriensis]MBB4909225.1 RNA polymerase-binding transcription factor DksA [Actinophytocola algeriensis]MBE1474387.1 RNA polymerase-binding transcription factor DksA [Actinophytocola algeriensis]
MTDPAGWLTARRAETLGLVDALSRRLDGIIEASAYTTDDDEHDPEGVTIAFERAQTAALLEQARTELRDLDAATERLAAGTYGTCLRCGGPIAPGRLEALPAATTCIRCADRRR